MPRSENPLDPSGGPVAALAADLRSLRAQTGMTYRVLSKRTGYAVSTLSVAASGVSLPSLDVTLAYAQSCGGDPQRWRARWQHAATAHQHQDRPDGAAPLVADPAPPLAVSPAPAPRRRGAVLRLRAGGVWAAGIAAGAILLSAAQSTATQGRAAPPAAPTARANGAPAASAPGSDGLPKHGCAVVRWPRGNRASAPYPAATAPGDLQRLPGQLALSPADGPLVLAPGAPRAGSSQVLGQLGVNFEDGYSADYLSLGASDGGKAFLTVTLATPAPGMCWIQLAYDAEAALQTGGTGTASLTLMNPGPHLAAAHAVLICTSTGPDTAPGSCTWAGPTTGSGTPFLGQFWIHPHGAAAAPTHPTEEQCAAYADQLFKVLTQ